MRHTRALIAAGAALAAVAGCGEEDDRAPAAQAQPPAATVAAAERAPARHPKAVVEDCSSRSMADFPGAFVDPDNIVAGPLVIAGAAYTTADTLREFGGDKVPVLVAPGHRVTLALTRRAHRIAALAYGPLPQGEIRHRDAHRAVTFEACAPGEPSGSSIDGHPVTFWMGFMMARERACVPLYAWIDDEPDPRRFVLGMGVRRCE
jgi:hypothetical protein